MDSHFRTIVKTVSYRTVVALSIFLAALAMNYSAGFGLAFVVLSYTVGFLSFWIQERIWNRVSWGKDGFGDLRRRSLAKTITWRAWSFVVLAVVGMLMGLNTEHAVEWSIVTNILFVVVHYLHERAWNFVKWERQDFLQEKEAV